MNLDDLLEEFKDNGKAKVVPKSGPATALQRAVSDWDDDADETPKKSSIGQNPQNKIVQ